MTYTKYIYTIVCLSLYFSTTNGDETAMCSKRLNNGSPGLDNISSKCFSKIIETSCPFIIQPLTYIFNSPLSTVVCPDRLHMQRNLWPGVMYWRMLSHSMSRKYSQKPLNWPTRDLFGLLRLICLTDSATQHAPQRPQKFECWIWRIGRKFRFFSA